MRIRGKLIETIDAFGDPKDCIFELPFSEEDLRKAIHNAIEDWAEDPNGEWDSDNAICKAVISLLINNAIEEKKCQKKEKSCENCKFSDDSEGYCTSENIDDCDKGEYQYWQPKEEPKPPKVEVDWEGMKLDLRLHDYEIDKRCHSINKLVDIVKSLAERLESQSELPTAKATW